MYIYSDYGPEYNLLHLGYIHNICRAAEEASSPMSNCKLMSDRSINTIIDIPLKIPASPGHTTTSGRRDPRGLNFSPQIATSFFFETTPAYRMSKIAQALQGLKRFTTCDVGPQTIILP